MSGRPDQTGQGRSRRAQDVDHSTAVSCTTEADIITLGRADLDRQATQHFWGVGAGIVNFADYGL
jgi:hypothetical protein